MKLLSKIVFFFLYVSTAISFISCEKEDYKETNIPYWRVYKKVSLIEFPQLYEIYNPVVIKKSGYKQHDIFIICLDNEYFSAFDATCTNHKDDFSHKTSYNKGDFYYKCNDCGTRFDKTNGIATKELNPNNTEIQRLQSYNCKSLYKNTILISNNR